MYILYVLEDEVQRRTAAHSRYSRYSSAQQCYRTKDSPGLSAWYCLGMSAMKGLVMTKIS